MLIKSNGNLKRLRGREVRMNANLLKEAGVPPILTNLLITLAEEQMHHEHVIGELSALVKMLIEATDAIGANSELFRSAVAEMERKTGQRFMLDEVAPHNSTHIKE